MTVVIMDPAALIPHIIMGIAVIAAAIQTDIIEVGTTTAGGTTIKEETRETETKTTIVGRTLTAETTTVRGKTTKGETNTVDRVPAIGKTMALVKAIATEMMTTAAITISGRFTKNGLICSRI